MKIPYSPQPLEVLQARYQDALVEVFDLESVLLGTAINPGQVRANVFDFENGVRLIVSRNRSMQGKLFLQVSGGLFCPVQSEAEAAAMVQLSWMSLSGYVGERPAAAIVQGIVYWTMPIPEPVAVRVT